MCVTIISNKSRITPEMVRKAWDTNKHGGGVAWRDGDVVRWKKGLDEAQMQVECATLPLPFIAHFRITSVGPTIKELCHPFPLTEDASLELEGETTEGALFHNGTWGEWRRWCLEASIRIPARLPGQPWSDTRAMAWLAFQYGPGILEMINERVAVLTPTGLQVYIGAGWKNIEGCLCSNDIFYFRSSYTTRPQEYWAGRGGYDYQDMVVGGMDDEDVTECSAVDCKNVNVDHTGYCPTHRAPQPPPSLDSINQPPHEVPYARKEKELGRMCRYMYCHRKDGLDSRVLCPLHKNVVLTAFTSAFPESLPEQPINTRVSDEVAAAIANQLLCDRMGCDQKATTEGLCGAHYATRLMNTGNRANQPSYVGVAPELLEGPSVFAEVTIFDNTVISEALRRVRVAVRRTLPPARPAGADPEPRPVLLPTVDDVPTAAPGGGRPPAGPFRVQSLRTVEEFYASGWISRAQRKKAAEHFGRTKKEPRAVPFVIQIQSTLSEGEAATSSDTQETQFP